ncbi:molybdate ABC transporter substrate-binding protein [Sporosarcina sp. HYO08]|uniref:molybdate ABC transporter substrate-binding protein n=1 Tax=Sporosarcina sp. HYO08 TaxID=1759557 RepID=UPI00079454A3|nr:molybdate ABC transporter substrate-binding protein [Sporosarcina sp. HYO08]KXH86696.1 molybdenum ABC transporter substrate-binding protein [Sporosarcina sp. HYO08]
MKKGIYFLTIGIVLLLLASCTQNEKTKPSEQNIELLISAAASLTDALHEVKTVFEENHDVTLTFNFNGSGKLAQQITQGAPADVFLSASKKDMDILEDAKLLLDESRVDFATNELVLITNEDSSLSIESFDQILSGNIGQVAIGDPESVPAGRYTKRVFEHLGLWEPLESKMVFSSNVRQVLTHVEMGNADLGVVYTSDAKISNKIKVLVTAHQDWHEPIVYPGAVIAETKHPNEAKAFLTFLTSEDGKTILHKYGFQ